MRPVPIPDILPDMNSNRFLVTRHATPGKTPVVIPVKYPGITPGLIPGMIWL